jgi:hypothetical protein
MSATARFATALAGAAWLMLGAVMISFLHTPGAADGCQPTALWTRGWFFVPPLVALVGLALAMRRSPRRAIGIGANGLLLALWGAGGLPLWLFLAIGHGASCGGG